MRVTRVRAPSNIAVLKYMGKEQIANNLPAHASLSLTLDGLSTIVELRDAPTFEWKGMPSGLDSTQGWSAPHLSAKGLEKVRRHLTRVFEEAHPLLLDAGMSVRAIEQVGFYSANSFPSDAGIASSASSFAAITVAGLRHLAESDLEFQNAYRSSEFRAKVSSLSRRGSGSSCRSLDGPWSLWKGESASQVAFTVREAFVDFVLVVSANAKAVSSSEAHERVLTSPLWNGRIERAQERLERQILALKTGDFKTFADETWAEAWEMHSLFHTSQPPFSYFVPETMRVLQEFLAIKSQAEAESRWNQVAVTLDAGPNVHVLAPESLREWLFSELTNRFKGVTLLEDRQGQGVEFL